MANRTLYDKIWDSHVILEMEDGAPLIYIDRHLIHEVTSPQAFSGLRDRGSKVRCPEKSLATMDHVVSTKCQSTETMTNEKRILIETLHENCKDNSIPIYDLGHPKQGIVHVIGPELGFTLPGTTIVCGDSHTSTHGAFGALAFGIGTTEIEHVLATQTLKQVKQKTLKIQIDGEYAQIISAKDIILHIIKELGVSAGVGYVIEFCGDVIAALSMEQRMTVCNMSVELGAKAGLIAPDATTFAYLKNRSLSPQGSDWDNAINEWRRLKSDTGAKFDKEIALDITGMSPIVTWGTTPEHSVAITDILPDPSLERDLVKASGMNKAFQYMGLFPGQKVDSIEVNVVFIGSCTNSRIEDLRAAALQIRGRKIAPNILAIIVPGSMSVKNCAEDEGLNLVFIEAGFEWRLPGCSMCVSINDDTLLPGTRCVSTSNRNFENRQGTGVRTHLVSPATAVESAIKGHLADARVIVNY